MIMNRIALAFVAFLLPFAFVACGVDSGEVYDKTYEPARSWQEDEPDYQYTCQYEYDPITGGFGNVCKSRFVGYKTVTKHEEECYRIMFRNDDGDKGDDCIGSEQYEAIDIGDWYEK
jgi:hypothetical protein